MKYSSRKMQKGIWIILSVIFFFMAHRYFMLYRIEGDRAIIDAIFHELQDYENRMG